MDGEGRLGGCEGSIWVVLGFPKTEGAKLEGAVVWGLLPQTWLLLVPAWGQAGTSSLVR